MTEPFSNAYVYVNGRPTVLVDPLGLCWNPVDCAKDAAGAVGGYVSDKVEDAADWTADKAGDALNAAVDKGDEFLTNYVDPALEKAATPIAGSIVTTVDRIPLKFLVAFIATLAVLIVLFLIFVASLPSFA